MLQLKAKVLYNKRVKHNYYHCSIRAIEIAKQACPGQFITVKFQDDRLAFLRRPFSIHKTKGANLEVLYEAVGPATKIFSRIKTGEHLDMIGPLGNGFSPQSTVHSPQLSILVAGGMGVAPLVFLAEKLAKHSLRSTVHGRYVLIGAKTRSQILCEKEFQRLGFSVKIATDDGSRGFRGKVTGLLKNLLSTVDCRLATLYACGPRPMLKEISRLALFHNVKAQISLEEHMACGIGACLGCVVKTKKRLKRVCKEGPVFLAKEIIW